MKYLCYVLWQRGFGDPFISWNRLLYTDPLTNHMHSVYFSLQRGTRPGCPLSPLLFALVMEPLANSIRHSINKGIFRGNHEHKISLYADDVILSVSDPLPSIQYIFDILQKFGRFLGYKLHLDKRELLPINDAANQTSLHSWPFKIMEYKLNHLGVCITKSHSQLSLANCIPLLFRTRQDLLHWSTMPQSLAG